MLSADRSDSVICSIDAAIARLRALSRQNIQSFWRWHLGDLSIEKAVRADVFNDWAIAPLNERQHIAWNRSKQVLWLGQQIQIPTTLHGFSTDGMTLRLALTWWAEDAHIFVDGVHVHSGDLFDCFGRILLRESINPGDTLTVAIRLVSPGHDDGALVRSLCLYENPGQHLDPVPEPGFVADEMVVLRHYLTAFAGDRLPELHQALQNLPWETVSDTSAFTSHLRALRDSLRPFSPWLKQRCINLLGHAHLDLAWLWPIADTWEAAQRTFESVLNLQRDFPDLVFTHSTPALYAWIEEHRPDLFHTIQQQVKAGTWEIGAGLWVEPEFNIVSGESIIRQVLYGQRYTREKFGHISRIAWLPDSFGFCWQLPQILRQGGIDYFATQKLRWNDTNAFPHDLFEWRSPDGTSIIGLTLPPIGSDIDPVAMAEYACRWEAHTGCLASLWLPGVGDHGGGPTRDMLALAHRWGRSPFFPTLHFTPAQDFLDQVISPPFVHSPVAAGQPTNIESAPLLQNVAFGHPRREELDAPNRVQYSVSSPHPSTYLPTYLPLPSHTDELYLELHRGCYTTHAEQKRWNRCCEVLLYQAELFASLAFLLTGADYPKAAIEQTWKRVLFNQFHDILPGSSIPEVYDEVNPVWAEAEKTAEALLKHALQAISQLINVAPPVPSTLTSKLVSSSAHPMILFNSLTWERSELVSVSLPGDAAPGHAWAVFDHEGNVCPCQFLERDGNGNALRFQAAAVPGVGYRVFWLSQIPKESIPDSPRPTRQSAPATPWILENAYLDIAVNPQTGELDRLFDKANQREVLAGAGNQLQFFRDEGQYWDAWNIAPDYESHPLPAAKLVSLAWVEHGPLRQRLRVVKTFGQSHIRQDYVLSMDSPVLRVETEVDWQENCTLLKVSFPLSLKATAATYEMPCGAIKRSPVPGTPHEQAKWEVPALTWADLGTENYGVSIFSDYKHGYDATPSRLRLTLLKSPQWPDPKADRGRHSFTYGLYPHQGRWTEAETLRLGYAFNQPLIDMPLLTSSHKLPSAESADAVDLGTSASMTTLPAIAQFLNIPNRNLVLTAFKPAEENAGQWIMRLYEGHGEPACLGLTKLFSTFPSFQQALRADSLTDLLENPIASDNDAWTSQDTGEAIAPWKIITLRIRSQPL